MCGLNPLPVWSRWARHQIPSHYEAVYFANTPAYFYGMSNAKALEELYLTFNLRRPADFRGHSLSVSDVVVLNREGQAGAFYVDKDRLQGAAGLFWSR